MPEGIEIVHAEDKYDVYGARSNGGDGHLISVAVGKPGWLGNPWPITEDRTRGDVVALYADLFITMVEWSDEFRTAVGALKGQRVACWCRHEDEHRPLCHLDVVNKYVKYGTKATWYFAQEEMWQLYGIDSKLARQPKNA